MLRMPLDSRRAGRTHFVSLSLPWQASMPHPSSYFFDGSILSRPFFPRDFMIDLAKPQYKYPHVPGYVKRGVRWRFIVLMSSKHLPQVIFSLNPIRSCTFVISSYEVHLTVDVTFRFFLLKPCKHTLFVAMNAMGRRCPQADPCIRSSRRSWLHEQKRICGT